MQIIKADRDAILKPLSIVSGIVERRHTLPILANILIRKQGTAVSFLGTDSEIQIQTTAELGHGNESVATTLSARKLLDILRALPAGEVTLSSASKKMTVQAGKSRFQLQTLAAEDFPTVAVAAEWFTSFSLPQKQLKHLFDMVHFAMAQQDIRYYLNGLLFAVEDTTVRTVTTDGHRLAFCSTVADKPLGKLDAIIPRKTVIELQRLLTDADDPVAIDIASNQLRLRFGSVELVSKLIEGKFPDYQRVIPTTYSRMVTVGREQLTGSLTRAAILASDKFRGVRFTLAPSSLKVQSSNAEQEEASDDLDVDYAGDTIEIGFNVSYLLDCLNNLKSDTVQLHFGDANSSALLTVPGDPSFRYVVMPMRI